MTTRLLILQAILIIAGLLLGAGLCAPAMTILPAFGKFDSWVKILQPDATRPTTYSLLAGILTLFRNGDAALGTLLMAFSVCFPAIKLALMSFAGARLEQGHPGGFAIRLAHNSGKFSMLDVLVIAMLVIAIKGLPGGSKIELRVGVWLFTASVMLSLIASILLHRREKQVLASAPPITP